MSCAQFASSLSLRMQQLVSGVPGRRGLEACTRREQRKGSQGTSHNDQTVTPKPTPIHSRWIQNNTHTQRKSIFRTPTLYKAPGKANRDDHTEYIRCKRAKLPIQVAQDELNPTWRNGAARCTWEIKSKYVKHDTCMLHERASESCVAIWLEHLCHLSPTTRKR